VRNMSSSDEELVVQQLDSAGTSFHSSDVETSARRLTAVRPEGRRLQNMKRCHVSN
jgi:hypothetical protein